jgi:hypothetical protein
VALATTASLAGAAPVRAQAPANAERFCVPTPTNACFAFAIMDEPTGFDVWLRNLSPYGDDVPNPFAIQEFAIRRVNTPAAGGARTDIGLGFTNSDVTVTESARRGGVFLSEDTGAGDYPAARTFSYSMLGSYGVLGCAVPTALNLAASGFVAQTCADRGFDGWLRIAFGNARVATEAPGVGLVTRAATAADVAVRVAGCLTHVGSASGVTGPFGGGGTVCESTPFAAAVVPEPTTAWMVAVGLGSLLAAGGARRGRRA